MLVAHAAIQGLSYLSSRAWVVILENGVEKSLISLRSEFSSGTDSRALRASIFIVILGLDGSEAWGSSLVDTINKVVPKRSLVDRTSLGSDS